MTDTLPQRLVTVTRELPKIVVLAPVKNEAWILDRFLSVCSHFADHIIIADQGSTDGSREIYRRFPKARVFENENTNYDEQDRQRLLINKARETIAGPRIFLAFDADEILAANAPQTLGWKRMLEAAPGTVLYFERPDLFQTTRECLRFPYLKSLGFVDDGSAHAGRAIHSMRVPDPDGAPRLMLNEIKVLHYNFLRMNANRAKIRRYCMIEHIRQTMRWAGRIVHYRGIKNWHEIGTLEKTPEEWLTGWMQKGIDMHSVLDSKYYDHDLAVLRMFAEHGVSHFYWDDIWDLDWERCRLWAKSIGAENIPEASISPPPELYRLLLRLSQVVALPLHKAWVRYKGIQ